MRQLWVGSWMAPGRELVTGKTKRWLEARIFSPSPSSLGRGEGPEMKLMISHAYMRSLHKTPIGWGLESYQIAEHIHTERVMYPSSMKAEAPILGTIPDLALCISSFDCSWFVSFISNYNHKYVFSWVLWEALINYWTWGGSWNPWIYSQLVSADCLRTLELVIGVWNEGSLMEDCALDLWNFT